MLNAITFVDAMGPCHSLENKREIVMGDLSKRELKITNRHSGRATCKEREEKFKLKEGQVRFLIVCEGKKTEPNYFKAFIENNTSVVHSEIQGVGMGTVALVKKTLEIKRDLEKKNAMKFDRVWVVFDKDDFEDFNEAIKEASRCGIQSAWTNESFELWYYLHFEYLDTAIGRKQYIEKLENMFKDKMRDGSFKYEKGASDIYDLLQRYGKEEFAIKSAEKLRKSHKGKGTNYAKHDPCTMVDKLVEELRSPSQYKEE